MNIKENLLIIKFTEEDFEETFGVFKIAIPYAFKAENDSEVMDAVDHEISEKKKFLKETINNEVPGQIFLVAKFEGKIIGVIAYGPSGRAIRVCSNGKLVDVGELGSLFVLPQYHNNGVGSALINAMMKHLNKIGIEDFCLDSGYVDAQKRWKRKFGKPYVVVKDYWAEGVDNMVWYCNVKDILQER